MSARGDDYRANMATAVTAGIARRVAETGVPHGRENDAVRRAQHIIMTPILISFVQGWLRSRYGIETGLLIERDEQSGRNRVALRLDADGCMQYCDVARLNALRKREPAAPMERVLLLFERTA